MIIEKNTPESLTYRAEAHLAGYPAVGYGNTHTEALNEAFKQLNYIKDNLLKENV